MAEQHLLTTERVAASPDWATLTERALDDVSRIVRSEIHMLQTSIETAVEARIDSVVTRSMTIAATVCGVFCILCAVILLLHQWLPWWQSFGIAGLLDNRAQAQLSKIPGIGDIPILGQLFRSKSVQRNNSELLVLVTPHIVDPVHVTSPAPPGPKPPMPYLDNPKFDKNLPGAKKTEPPPQPMGSK